MDPTSSEPGPPAPPPGPSLEPGPTVSSPGVSPGPVAAPPPTPRQSLRERVEGHPLGFIVGVILAAVTATVTIVVPVLQMTQDNRVSSVQSQMEQDRTRHAAAIAQLQAQLDDLERTSRQQLADEEARSQARIEELDRSLSSIKRSLGTDTEYFDVGKLVVSTDQAAALPATSRFFPDDRFYGLDVAQATGWTYALSSELQLTAEALGVTEEQLRANSTPAQIRAMTGFPVHVWRYGPDRPLTYTEPSDGKPYVLHARTEAWLQRVSQDDYLAFLEASLPGPLPSGATLAQSVHDGFARDPAGWVLQDQLVSEISTVGSLRPRIDSLQKRDDLAYARVETVLPGAQLGDQHFGEYYWDREWLIVRTDRDVYLVKLFVADDDHRAPDYGALSTWLDQLRILGS